MLENTVVKMLPPERTGAPAWYIPQVERERDAMTDEGMAQFETNKDGLLEMVWTRE